MSQMKAIAKKKNMGKHPPLFSKRQPPFQLLPSNIKLLVLCRFWNRTSNGNFPRAGKFLLAAIFGVMLLPAVTFTLRHLNDVQIVMKSLTDISIVLLLFLRFSFFTRHYKLLEVTFRKLDEIYQIMNMDRNENVSRLLQQLQTNAECFLKVYAVTTWINSGIYALPAPIRTIVKYATTGQSDELPMTFATDFVLFDYESSFWIWFPLAIFSMLIFIWSVLLVSPEECFMWNLLHHVSCAFKIIRLKVIHLEKIKDPEIFRKELVAVIDLHGSTFRIAKNMEACLNGLIMIIYGTCTMVICIVLFTFTTIEGNSHLRLMCGIVIYYNVVVICVFSFLGTELIDASSSVADAVYSINWYERSPDECRMLLFLMMRSQRVATITASKFFTITRSSFAGALRNAFSYFTILMQFYGN